jgi:colicin import membrane protein
VAHVVLVVFFTVRAVFFPEAPIDYRAAIRVDIVDLPDKIPTAPEPSSTTTAPPQPPPEAAKPEPPKPAEPAKVEVKPEVKVPPLKKTDAVDLSKAKNEQKKALEKLKQMSALDEIKKQVAQADSKKSDAAKFQFKGNALSPGTDLTGLSKIQHDDYVASLDRHVKQYWALPEWLARKSLSVRIRIKIDERGFVIKSEIVKSSGNPDYDDRAIAAVQRASPFPAPPSKLVNIVGVDGILLGFPE